MDDMQDLVKQFSSMLENNTVPDNIKDIISNINSNNSSASDNIEKNDSSSSSFDNIDFETILKMKSIMDSLNSVDDPRANLLLSLKPYLKDSRKSKLDQYIQFLNMGKVFENFKNTGSDFK